VEPIVDAPSGRYAGAYENGVAQFLGIRYAHDTRHTRFTAPVPLARAAETVRAWEYGDICPQRGRVEGRQSEDCLNLNIWTPTTRGSRPVMVYIHGGAYNTGSGNDALTHGARLAADGNVVVVTITHRINAFGYLYLAGIDRTFADSGNAGQLDLIAALRWVRTNIAAFGGNPQNVTLFGQSGGGAKISTLLAMPAAKGLFHKAITMSGQQVTASGPQNASRRTATFLAALRLSPAEAALASPAVIVDALATRDPILDAPLYFGPVLDLTHLPRHPFYPDAAPTGSAVPMVMGNTVAETRAFFPPEHAALQGLNWDNFAARIAPELRVDIDAQYVLTQYRSWFPQDTPAALWIKATTASRSWRAQVIQAERRAEAKVPAFVYQLNFRNAKHTDDIALVFGNVATDDRALRAMGARFMGHMVRFAETGDPAWSAYHLDSRATMLLDEQSRLENDPRGRERRLFASVPYIQPGT
jgi:para-nitrobenzyl esterase